MFRFVMAALETYSGASTVGMDVLLFLADVALATGAKLEVRFLLLVYLVIFGIWIFISIIIPPALILIGWVFTTYIPSVSGSNIYAVVLNYVTNIKGIERHKVLFLVYHSLTFALGWLYLYIWICCRSLFIKISPIQRIHILPGQYNDKEFRSSQF